MFMPNNLYPSLNMTPILRKRDAHSTGLYTEKKYPNCTVQSTSGLDQRTDLYHGKDGEKITVVRWLWR